ncbi:MAG: hypothetical protein Q4B63_11825 [Clostridium perfringens]|nr:hypothetical protein [Clostridium perfringens]
MESYNKKIVVSGNMIEVYEYKNHIYYEKPKKQFVKQNRVDEIDGKRKKELQRKSSIRAKRELARIIYCNVEEGSKFLTLTYEDNIMDLDIANNEFKKFIKRLNYKYGLSLKYTAVVEFQERGSIHYHAILYNLTQRVVLNELATIWGNGFIKINEIQNTSDDIEKVKNYMLKDIMKNDIRLIGRKRYFNSRGIKRSEEIKDIEEVEDLLSELSMDYFKGGRVTENNYNEVDIKKYVIPIK